MSLIGDTSMSFFTREHISVVWDTIHYPHLRDKYRFETNGILYNVFLKVPALTRFKERVSVFYYYVLLYACY